MTTTIQVPIYYDVLSEQNETFRVTLSNPTNGSVIMSGTAYGTIIDAPVNPMFVSITEGQSAVVEGSNASFSIARSSTDGPLTVYFQETAGNTVSAADFAATPAIGSVHFATGQGEITVTVTAIKDDLLEYGEQLSLELLAIAPGTQGPSQYLISSSGMAGMSFHDGYHGEVDTPFTVEYQDWEGIWHAAPDNETLWVEEPHKWLPTIPSEIVQHVDDIYWVKRPQNAPQTPWTIFAAGTLQQPAVGNPGFGYWDVSFQAFYDVASYFLAVPDDKAVNDVASVVWEKGHADQRFENLLIPLADGPEVFPEKNEHDGDTFNQVKVLVTLAMPCAPTTTCTVNLKVLDPDHFHNPVDADDEFDPNDVFGAGPGGATDINKNDHRKSSGAIGEVAPFGIGSPLMTLQETSLTIPSGATTAFTIGTITDPQPGNNYIVPAMPRWFSLNFTGISDSDGVTVVYQVSDFGNPPTITYFDVPDKYHTDILTVWRTLWVELDSMRAANPATDGTFLPEPDTNADLVFDPLDPAIGLFAAQYARACIDVKTIEAALDVTDGQHIDFFLHNMENPDVEGLRASAMADIADENSDDFWVMQLVAGYEGPDALSNDPNAQPFVRLGRSITDTNIAYVYQEAIRDLGLNSVAPNKTVPPWKLELRTALHESGHLMGLPHPPFVSIMDAHTVSFGLDEENVFAFSELGRIQGQVRPESI